MADENDQSSMLHAAGSPEGRASTFMTPQHCDRNTGKPEVESQVKGSLVWGHCSRLKIWFYHLLLMNK